jgi:hypothetical protein
LTRIQTFVEPVGCQSQRHNLRPLGDRSAVLNAESELGVLSAQCLDRADNQTLIEVIALGSTTAIPITPNQTGNSPPRTLVSNLSIDTLQTD